MHDPRYDNVAALADLVRCPQLLGPGATGPSLLRAQTLRRGCTTSPEGVVRPILTHHALARPAPVGVDEARPARYGVLAKTLTGWTTAPRSAPRAGHRRASARPGQSPLCARFRSLPASADPRPQRSLDLGSRRVAGGHPLAVRARRVERSPVAAHARSPGRLVPHPTRIRQGDCKGRAQVEPAPEPRLS